MTVIDMKDVGPELPSLLSRVRTGEEIVIANEGKPVVRLTPTEEPASQRGFGMFKGQVWMSDDFDAPLPPEELAEWEKWDFGPERP